MKDIIIVGAGMAGLIAAFHFKNAKVIDAGPSPVQNHQALLRFRSDAIADLTGIPFKRVTVHKEVYGDDGGSPYCSIAAANCYSKKVAGVLAPRSVLNLAPETRYIAPHDFYWQLLDRLGNRVEWGRKFDAQTLAAYPEVSWISTAPMSVNIAAAGIQESAVNFDFQKSDVTVVRIPFNVPADVYQTMYFPDPSERLFRASITGDVLILEMVDGRDGRIGGDKDSIWNAIELACYAMGLDDEDLDTDAWQVTVQKFGKILDMPRATRESVMYELTREHKIFSLGRFATWRNILLDDVVKDLGRIEALMTASEYGRLLHLAPK